MNLFSQKFRLNLWFLGLFFYPLLFFTLKLDNFDISFFKIIAIISILLHTWVYVVLERNTVSKMFILFGLLCVLSLVMNDFSLRLFMNIVSYAVVLMFSIVGASLLKSTNKVDVLEIFKKVLKGWYFLLFLGLIQLFLTLYGIDLAWESIGEPSPENKGYLFGKYLLRPASVYGEPRDFSAFVILIPCLYAAICKGRSIRLSHLYFFILLGISTQSTTFFLVMMFYILVFNRESLTKIFLTTITILVLLSFSLPYLKEILPRLYFVEDFNLKMLNSPLFAEQAGDLSFIFYIVYSDLPQLLFGNGIGSSSNIIAIFTDKYMSSKSSYLFINSRWLFYTWLVDFGLILLLVLGFLLKKHLPRDSRLNTLALLSVGTSMFTGNLIFIFVILILNRIDNESSSE